jgi:hypothetical protein
MFERFPAIECIVGKKASACVGLLRRLYAEPALTQSGARLAPAIRRRVLWWRDRGVAAAHVRPSFVVRRA